MQNRDDTQETTGKGGDGLTIRVGVHFAPFQYWATVPPTAMQNFIDEQETKPRATGAMVHVAAHAFAEVQERPFGLPSLHDLPFQRATRGLAG